MTSKNFSCRLLAPFNGTLHTVAVENGEAETTDGVHWVLYVAHEDIVAHTGLFEVRYGTWDSTHGLSRAIVRGTAANNLIEKTGKHLVTELEQGDYQPPFRLADHYECWLLDEENKQPLVLMQSSDEYHPI